MAKNPTSLQEPTMDELLASIREIIEESSAAEEDALLPIASVPHDNVGDFLPEASAAEDVRNDATQEDQLVNATMPIQDAMKALAARIGLKKQGDLRVKPVKELASSTFPSSLPSNISAFPASLPNSSSTTSTVKPFPANRASSNVLHNIATQGGVAEAATSAMIPPEQGSPAPASQPLPSISLSTSIQATSQNTTKTSAKSQISTKNQEPLPIGHIPLYPKFRISPFKPLPQPSARLSSSPLSTETPPQSPITETSPPAPYQPEFSAKEQGNKQELSDLEKGFLAEFEQSAELLLRPYIAGWLEKHFHHLFEKILREEIQRLVRKNLP